MKKRLLCLAAALLVLAGCAGAGHGAPESVNVPILMYHHIDDTGGADAVISQAAFRHQMDVLQESGYTPVSFDDLMAYVDGEGTLPERPVCITFDDGYESTYERAFPVLREYRFPATVFVIGCSVGHKEFYKDTAWPITPHFDLEQMAEMVADRLMAVQSHTYDMHQWAPFETDAPRTSILPMEGETEEAYIAALKEDFQKEADILAAGGVEKIQVLAYPLGRSCDLAEQTLAELGVRVTLTIDSAHVNTVIQGRPETLLGLGRMNMGDDTTDEALLAYLAQ